MPGFGIEDDELKKLFAEAEGAVKKATTARPAPMTLDTTPVVEAPVAATAAPAPPPPEVAVQPVAPPRPVAPPTPPPQPQVQSQPMAAPAPTPPPASNAPVRLMGGEQDAEGLTVRTQDGQSIRLPWSSIRAMTLGRVAERQWLGFVSGSSMFFFADDNVAYKGLLKALQASTAMNWRGLVTELAAQVADQSDPGIAVFSSAGAGGGSIPKYQDRQAFWAAVTARA